MPLQGEVVAISGRLVSLSHADAADLISSMGGRFSRTVNRKTTMLVVGGDGLPLSPDGEADAKLRLAFELVDSGVDINVVSEADFLVQTDQAGSEESVRREYTLAELTQIVGVSAHTIRRWVRHGLLSPIAVKNGLQLFDFGQVSRLGTLAELASNGVSPAAIRKGLEQLSLWLDNGDPAELLTALDSHRHNLIVRLKDGRFAETRGQLLFDFDSADEGSEQATVLGLPTTPLLERAMEYEDEGNIELAAAVYREVLDRGDEEPETRFHFANVLYNLGQVQDAIELFEEALDRDADYVEAWNNVGSAYLDLDRAEDAVVAFRRALDLRPNYADAHFNLATTLDELGDSDAARPHWVAFLNLSESTNRSTGVRSRRLTAKQHVDDSDQDSPMILRFQSPQ
ncbi:MAG: tetratricopeptide repeat protein [Planctomycetaceae bacterium]